VFGATYAEVGAYLLGLWGFSDAIVKACAYHHHPAQAQERSIVSVIHVANVYDQVGDALLTAEELPDLALITWPRSACRTGCPPGWRRVRASQGRRRREVA
jgi:hypothetical protein